MHICLDIDDTITYAPNFFVGICNCFSDARISIVTFRPDLDSARNYLRGIGLRYHDLIVSTDPSRGKLSNESLHEWKARFVNNLRPDFFFEDMPEVVALIDDDIVVFMPCDPVIRSWIKSKLDASEVATQQCPLT